jgi:hypothetical protein
VTEPVSAAVAVAAYTPDLMDRSRISSALGDVRFVASPDALVGLAGVDVVLIDLSKKGVLDALAAIVASDVRVIAYGSHVDKNLLDSARAAGVDEVLPRSRFFGGLPALVTGG